MRPYRLSSIVHRQSVLHLMEDRSMRKYCCLLHLLVLLSTLIVLVACGTGPQQAGNAGSPITTAISSPQGDAWAQARAALPADVPVLRPNFVPDRFSSPTLLEARVDKDNGP